MQQFFENHPLYSRLWEKVGEDDRKAYALLYHSTHDKNDGRKENHLISFQKDLNSVMSFIERRPECREERAIISGFYFTGSFICVNTRQLKFLMGRCKSSLNNGFQSLGYMSAKAKSKQWFMNCLPSLLNDNNLFRQWTIRCLETKIPCKEKHVLAAQPQPRVSETRKPLPLPIFLYNNTKSYTETHAESPPPYEPRLMDIQNIPPDTDNNLEPDFDFIYGGSYINENNQQNQEETCNIINGDCYGTFENDGIFDF